MANQASYRPEIDGLRFFAIAIVFLGHLTERVSRFSEKIEAGDGLSQAIFHILSQPGSGVLLFFTISGFILSRQMKRDEGSILNPKFLKNYFIRRFSRIEPPYLLMITATFLLIAIFGITPPGVKVTEPSIGLFESYVATVFYAHDWYFGQIPTLFGPGWTLEVEIQFYTILPFVLGGVLLISRHRVLRVAIFLALLVISVVFAQMFVPMPHRPFLDRSIIQYFSYFWLGVMLSWYNNEVSEFCAKLTDTVASFSGWAGIVILSLSPILLPPVHERFAVDILRLFAITLAFIGALSGRGSFFVFCARPWVSLIGAACYSIYLTHLQIFQVGVYGLLSVTPKLDPLWNLLIAYVVLIPVALLVGLVFYSVVERTFMAANWPRSFATWVGRIMARNRR